MKRRTETHPRRVARETLRSGRIVHIDRIVNVRGKDAVVVRVGGDAGWAVRTLPVQSFLGFGRPLADRIRRAIIQLDHPIEDVGPDEVEQAVETALFHGGPQEETDTYIRREPPLVSRDPPPPPPPARREPEALRFGPTAQPPPAGPPPDDPPSE